MSEENLRAFRELVEAGNRGDVDGALRCVAEDVEWIAARSAVQGPYRGHQGIRAFFADNEESFEVFRGELDELRDLGDQVLVFGKVHVRGRGSGVETDIPIAGIATYRDGRLIRWEDFRERNRALEAAGLSH